MFDIAFGEVVVIIGGIVLLGGKHDLPVIARYAGRGFGKVVGIVRGFQNMVADYSNRSDLAQLHSEVKSGLDELNRIKYEISTAASMRRTPVQIGDRTIITPDVSGAANQSFISRQVLPHQRQASEAGKVSGAEKKTSNALNPMSSHIGAIDTEVSEYDAIPPSLRAASSEEITAKEDSLAALVIADITFKEDGKDSFAQKKLSGGANILNECIINSLLAGQMQKHQQRRRPPPTLTTLQREKKGEFIKEE